MNKKYNEKLKLVERAKLYSPAEALALLPRTARAKFDETVDLSVKLGVDVAKNPSVRGTVALPAGSGRSKKVAVITKPDRVKEAEAAGAVAAGAADLIERIKGGWLGFDVLIASPDMMPEVGKLGKILGAKGLMPNPKTGTVTPDIAKAVKEFQGGKVEFRMDKGGVVHLGIGKVSFKPEALQQNLTAVLSALGHAKPGSFKGVYVKSITVSTTMGPGIKIDAGRALDEVKG
ncbi:MAG: 50S ribosomal protein L1 [Candidatus Saganbacteria bacterium]|nr:50S ribosomal protein L1 [Candidatus Saganbacteria bacterium]